MFQLTGQNRPLTPFRRLVTDLMHFSAKVPSITAERRMNLAPLVEARRSWASRPGWCVLFTKAFGIVAARRPEVRQAYMTCPWPHLYEHPDNVAAMTVTRWHGDEDIVLMAHVPTPERQPLEQLDALVHYYQTEPLERLACYRNARRLSRVPWPVRHWLWWAGLNVSGAQRTRHFGTFGITSTGAQGAGIVRIIPLLTATLHYGLFDEESRLDMRLSYDHRVFDGATAARALVEMEDALHDEILTELRQPKPVVVSAVRHSAPAAAWDAGTPADVPVMLGAWSD